MTERLIRKLSGAIAARGITLVETLIVVVVMAILASVVLPALTDSTTSQLRGAAIVMARDLQYVQTDAINTGRTLRVDFGGNEYQVLDPSGGVGGAASLLRHPQSDYPAHNGQFIVNFDDPGPLRGVTIASASFSGKRQLEFGKYGEPLAAGEVVLRCRDIQVRLAVAPVTGAIAVGEIEKAP